MKSRAAVLAVVLSFLGIGIFASSHIKPQASTNATWNLYVPQACAKQALIWTNGREHFDDMPLREFLKLKTEIEGCGGKIALAAPVTKG
jgi:hypothetical protein